MIFRFIILIVFLFTFSSASFQKISIGQIDTYYQNRITAYELRNILDEIEYQLESKLNINIFDYSSNGKKINLVYLPPSKLEKRIVSNLQKLKEKEKSILNIKNSFNNKQKKRNELTKIFKKQNYLLNKKIKSLNDYVKKVNKQKNMSQSRYIEVKSYMKLQKEKIDKEYKKLKKEESILKKYTYEYNKNIRKYNSLIYEHKRINNKIERMSKSFKKVKGMTFGLKEIKLKTYYVNGKLVKEKSVNQTMEKIDIYGFDSKTELKTILAHEILHLVGIPHINKKNTLMNPILQKNQLKSMSLTREDISNFNKNF